MNADLGQIIRLAEATLGGVEAKSWFRAASASHRCLCAMPSPTWAEQVPGVATYGPGDRELHQALNALRYTVLTWARAFVHPGASWELVDTWPEPTALREAIEGLKGFLAPLESTSSVLEPSVATTFAESH